MDGTLPKPGNDLYKRKKDFESTVKLKNFIEDVSVTLPGKKTVDKTTLTQKKILPKPVRVLQKEFSNSYPDNKVSRATFYRHIPKHVLTCSKHRHRSCLCEICLGVDNKLVVLNRYLNVTFDGRDSLSDMTLCPTVTLECLQRSCEECGVEQLKWGILDQMTEETQKLTVKWINWEPARDNQKKKGPEQVEKNTTLLDMCLELFKDLQWFAMHLFVFRWQFTQYRLCKSIISERPTFGLAVLDFAENMTLRPQNQIQSAYYGYTQVTIHPSVLFYACPVKDCGELIMHYMVFVSDDLKHDAAMAQTILDKTLSQMKSSTPGLQQVVIFSDGCAGQYKSKLPFHYLSRMTEDIKVDRAYFGSRHGKGPCDACGGVVKKLVDNDVLSGQAIIKDARSMVQHCSANYSITPEEMSQTCCHTRRMFVLLEESSIDRTMSSSGLKTVPGTRKLHQIRKVKADLIQTRNLACFCNHCMDGDDNSCENQAFVKPWETIHINYTTLSSTKISEGAESDYSEEESCIDANHEGREDVAQLPKDTERDKEIEDKNKEECANTNYYEVEKTKDPMSLTWNAEFMHDAFFVMPLSREEFFETVQDYLSKCDTFEELVKNSVYFNQSMDHYELPENEMRYLYDVGKVDSRSLRFVPSDCNLFPVEVEADGNCVPRSFSCLVFGDQEHHIEVRCRIVMELSINQQDYLSLDSTDLKLMCQLSDFFGKETEQVFQLETMAVSKMSVFMGMWQLMAAANAFHATVSSVYPKLTQEQNCYEMFCNRLLNPRQARTTHVLNVLWTSTRKDVVDEHFAANHVVPLMPLTKG